MIKWLLRNLPQKNTVFLNNCTPFADPFAHNGEVEVNGTRCRSRMRDLGHSGPAADAIEGEAPAFVLVSYERWVPGMETTGTGGLSGELDERGFAFEVLVYRGFLNWLASLVMLQRRKVEAGRSKPEPARQMIEQQLARYEGVLRSVGGGRDDPRTPVCYDRWFESADYRAERLAALGLPVRDNRLGRVSPYGGGSSFEQVKRGQDLSAGDRWQAMMPDPEYRAWLAKAAQNESFMAALAAVFPTDADILSAERV
ncbi:hypothetical protein ACW9UR_11380 [Halovulum sp. GXIMD14794]